MDEEETQAETKSETDSGDGDKPKNASLVDGAYAAAERIEAANKKQEELIQRQEELIAKQMLAGRTEAGQVKEKPKEETPEEYAEKIRRGEVNPLD